MIKATSMPTLDNAHGLVVGIANYQHITKLPSTVVKDAQDICNLLSDPQHCGYLPDNVQLLLDGEATQAAIRQALACLAERSDPDSVVFFYLSSLGSASSLAPRWIDPSPPGRARL